MDLHPYDGTERRFQHTDADCTVGYDIVAWLLGVSTGSLPEEISYDLSFYSGGIGVYDRLAITFPVSSELWTSVITKLDARTLDQAIEDVAWLNELNWLFDRENDVVSLQAATIMFINHNRRSFQTECQIIHRILLVAESNVNNWAVLWGDENTLNYLGYDQG